MFRSPDSGASALKRAPSSFLSDRRAASVAAGLLGLALAGVAFGAAGGTELTRTTTVEVLMVLVGGAVAAAAVVWAPNGPLHGATTLILLALFVLVTALSITWAVVPELSYIEAGRALAYLAVFAAGVAGAQLAPRASPVVIKGILLAAMAAVVYALVARVWPASLAENELSNRIGQPFEYWNAVGTTAALAMPGLLWLAARRTGTLWGRALAYSGMGAAILAILLTQSRGALAAGVLGVIVWLAVVPLRLRSMAAILVPALGAGAVAAWALSKDAFSVTAQPLAVKESVAGEFGLLLALMAVGLFAAGYAINLALDRELAPAHLREKAGIATAATAGVAVLAALAALTFSDRGLTGTIDDRIDELTSETDTAPTEQGAGRFTGTASTRGKYWKEARLVFEDRPAIGTGAGTFRVARLRHRTDPTVTGHAHGFVPQTLADLGIVGLVASTLLLVAWLVAAARATALYPRRLPFRRATGEPPPRRDWTGERIALVALTLIVVVFGLQSAIDWTWFVPGAAALALVAAGFVAGRGPLVGARADEGTAELRPSFAEPSPPRLFAAAGVLLAALLTAWAIWQPESSDRATGDALALSEEGAVDSALHDLDAAADANPLSAKPLVVRAAIETEAGREDDARDTLENAVLEFPGEPDTWYRLAAFQLGTLDRPERAAQTVQGALYLDPLSLVYRQLFLDARARAREKQAEAAERRARG